MITLVVLFSLTIVKSYADNSDTFSVRLIPDKLLENSDGVLEIYALHDGHTIPSKIGNMVYSSTDSSIVQVLGSDGNGTGFSTHVKIRANNVGTANIVIAAPGFTPIEFPIVVYGDEVSPTSLLIKATPSTFSIDGPKKGYFSIELVNTDGHPTLARHDTMITLASTNNQMISLSTSTVVIKNGQYYAIGQFETNQIGTATIIASAPSFQSVSATVTITSAKSPTIQAYVYPSKINDFATSTAYVVAQLKDSTGNEMLARQDIPLSVMITNATATGLVNTSPQGQLITANGQLIIKKGDYEGYATLQVNAGLNGTFNIDLSAPEGYVVSNHTAASAVCSATSGCVASSTLLSTPIRITTVTSQILNDKSARLDVLPILATGKNELIGIMHLEDPHGEPVIASKDLQIEVDSSDPNYLSVGPVRISQGSADALVFGRVGDISPSSSGSTGPALSLHVVTYDDTTIPVGMNASSTDSFKLVADPIIPKLLGHSDFPLAIYLVDSTNSLSSFPQDYQTTILPNDYFQIDPIKISSGDAIDLLNAQSLKNGSSTLHIITGSYSATATLSTVDSSPASIGLDYPSTLLAGYPNLLGLEVFDSNSNPRYLDSDVQLKIISSNDSIISTPTNVLIPKGNYYSQFYIVPKLPGDATVSVVANNLPLATYKIKVESMIPTVSINAPALVSPENVFFANMTAERFGKPLPNLNIVWKVTGAIIQSSDKITDSNGTANISLLSGNMGRINITASMSGSGFNDFVQDKIIQINSTQFESTSSTNASSSSTNYGIRPYKINGIDPLPIIVVVSIAAGGVLIKKKKLHLSTSEIRNNTNVS